MLPIRLLTERSGSPRETSFTDAAASSPPSIENTSRWARRWICLASLAVLTVGAALAYQLTHRAKPVRYITAEVQRGSVIKSVSASGTVNPVLTIIVGSYVSGVIQELHCDFNTLVKVGQVCARIDPRPYQVVVEQDQAALATSKAQVQKDKANLAYLKLNYDRLVWLLTQDSTSKDAVDLAKSAYEQGQAQLSLDEATVEQRAAELKAAQVNLGYTNITSPVDGTVVARNVTQGQTVAASFQTPTLFLIATDLTAMQVDSNVSESDIGQLQLGQAVRFSVEAYPDHQFVGKVTQIRQAPQTVQNVVTYDAIVSVNNDDRLLLPGMTATLRIVVAERNDVLRVPDQALRYTPSAPKAPEASSARAKQVWVLRGTQPQALAVTIGLDDDSYTEITAGALHAGDRVVIGESADATGSASSPALRFGS